MNGTLVRAWTGDYNPVAMSTYTNVMELASTNFLEPLSFSIPITDKPRHPSWFKLDYMVDLIEDHTFNWHHIWMDVDIMVRDPKFSLIPYLPNNGIAFSSDSNGLCAGFFIAIGQWALDFLKAVRFLGSTGELPDRQEQDSFKALLKAFPGAREHVTLLPPTVVSNPEIPIGSDKAFARHFWANGWKDKLALAKYITEQT